MSAARRDASSFRDPAGHVYLLGERILRSVTSEGAAEYEFVRDSGLHAEWSASHRVIFAKEVSPELLGIDDEPHYLLEHPRLPFISYPYEWCFSALRAAALLQLDLLLEGLERDVTLSDASPYNVQFRGTQPCFIDLLSFCRYREGDYWHAHTQFCEQYLNPLLLTSYLGIPFNSWLRGSLDGIPTLELAKLLRWHQKASWRALCHIVMPSVFQGRALRQPLKIEAETPRRPLPRAAYRSLVLGLRRWIANLKPHARHSTWRGYSEHNTYRPEDISAKHEFVRRFASSARPDLLLDMGCNIGLYSESALEAGARRAIGFDADIETIDAAFQRASSRNLDFLPLYFDAADPSPNQGWRGKERQGLSERSSASALLALAFIHHLVIARNLPLEEVIDWLVGLAPEGVIEFVAKDDPTVALMLHHRKDIFPNYDRVAFLAAVRERAEIVAEKELAGGKRLLIQYRRKPSLSV